MGLSSAPHAVILSRVLAVLLVLSAAHWVTRFAPWYFVTIGLAAIVLLANEIAAVPRIRFLSNGGGANRIAAWIVLVAAAAIGGLHNANEWTPQGALLRPTHITLWKTELILVMSLTAPGLHWLVSSFSTRLAPMDGRRFATEFALYVNFSGIALVLWTGEAAVSASTLGAALALVLLAELTLHASA